MGSMAQTGLLLVPSDALGHTWALLGALGGGQGLPPPTGPKDLKSIESFHDQFRYSPERVSFPLAVGSLKRL